MEYHHAGHRLITQNLLAAAASCETDEPMTWSNLEQLSILVDLVCLYDRIWIIGRQAFSMLEAFRSGPYTTCRSAFDVDNFNVERIVHSASCRIAGHFHDAAGPERYRSLVESILTRSSVERSFRPVPDQIQDHADGELWLRTLPDNVDAVRELNNEEKAYRSVTFFLRTFLYVAHAEMSQIPFTPDCARVPFVPGLVENERLFRRRLTKELKESVEDSDIMGDLHVIRATTPLASAVFANAANRREIWQAAADLREKLWPMRARIRAAEDDLFWATQQEQARAASKWDHVFEELKRTYGQGQGYVTCDGLVGFAEKALEVLLDPTKWIKLVSAPIDLVKVALARRPIIEMHKLARDVPGSWQAQRDIKRLFGEIRAG